MIEFDRLCDKSFFYTRTSHLFILLGSVFAASFCILLLQFEYIWICVSSLTCFIASLLFSMAGRYYLRLARKCLYEEKS